MALTLYHTLHSRTFQTTTTPPTNGLRVHTLRINCLLLSVLQSQDWVHWMWILDAMSF